MFSECFAELRRKGPLIHNITNYSTCCRQFTCTASIEHGISKHISMYKYCIKHIIYTVKIGRASCRERV